MPKIAEYTAPPAEQTLRPSDLAAETGQRAAARIGEMGQERAYLVRAGTAERVRALDEVDKGVTTLGDQVEKHQSLNEITAGFANLATLTDTLDQSYSQHLKAADPFDPNVSKNWREEVLDPSLTAFTQSFNTPAGRQWAAEHAATLATEMYRHTVAADMNRAADTVQNSLDVATKKLTGMVERNPAMADSALSLIPGTVDYLAKTNNISPDMLNKVRTELTTKLSSEIAQTQLKSILLNDPNADISGLANKYSQAGWVSGEELNALTQTQGQLQRLQQGQARADDTTRRQVDNDAAKQQLNDLTNSVIARIGNGGTASLPADFYPKLSQYLMMPGANAEQGRAMAEWAQKSQEARATDPAAYADLASRLFKPAGAPGAVTDEELFRAQLSPTDYAHLHGAWENTQKPENSMDNRMVDQALDSARTTLTGFDRNPATGAPTPQSEMAYSRFMTWFTPTYQGAIRAGKSPADAVQMLITPENLSKFAWDAGESGAAIAAIIPPKPTQGYGSQIGHFFGNLWHATGGDQDTQ